MELKAEKSDQDASMEDEKRIRVNQHKYVLVMGGPGAGKSTLCGALANTASNVIHINVGQLLRDYKGRASTTLPETGSFKDPQSRIRDYMRAGKLLPADLVLDVLKERVDLVCEHLDDHFVFLIDGYPRDAEQARMMNFGGSNDDIKAIQFICDRQGMLQRVLSRAAEDRVDDNVETFDKRMDQYELNMPDVIQDLKVTIPVQSILHFRSNGSLDELVSDFEEIVRECCESPRRRYIL
ncbi:cytidine monophosphate (UMP-CMP) kinase 1, cytosolic [Orbilia brochopaga]|uniref:Cytidine monophosphate (UMP-CMP) kinase 1, cytosolic n=1 Tax=Orbilia brochopaga TaxID=3140254 RepID=A0AAV9UQA6_9PEZI